MKYKTFAYCLIAFFLFTGIFIFEKEVIKNIENSDSDLMEHLKTSTNSGRIHIVDNWTETKAAGICTGEGTESDPYTLENLNINAGGIGDALCIENTTEYFKIKNCKAFNSGGGYEDAGIKLINVKNGLIANNTVLNNSRGVSIFSSLNLIFTMNSIIYNVNGMKLIHTNDSILYLNSFTLNSYIQFSCQWSYVDYYSKEKFSYTYNESTFTNYLGNFWEGYNGHDEDGDGIGDTPHLVYSYIPDNPDLKDFYPLIEPIGAYSNIEKVDVLIPGYNLISLLGVISIIMILLATTMRKLVSRIQ